MDPFLANNSQSKSILYGFFMSINEWKVIKVIQGMCNCCVFLLFCCKVSKSIKIFCLVRHMMEDSCATWGTKLWETLQWPIINYDEDIHNWNSCLTNHSLSLWPIFVASCQYGWKNFHGKILIPFHNKSRVNSQLEINTWWIDPNHASSPTHLSSIRFAPSHCLKT